MSSIKICIVGASSVTGNHDSAKGGWATRLKLFAEYEIKKEKYRVYPLGIAAETSNEILKRLDNELSVRNPSLVIFHFGGNDSSYRRGIDGQRTTLEQYKHNIEGILEITKKYTGDIILIEMHPVDEKRTAPVSWNDDAFYYNKDVERYNEVMRKVCSGGGVSLIKAEEFFDEAYWHDGIHLNAKGHEKIYQVVKKYLLENKLI